MTMKDKRELLGTGGQPHPAEHIEAAHDTLRNQLDVIKDATTRTALLRLLLPLHEMLREHFAVEERLGGFYEDLLAHDPSMAHDLDALRDEHRVILDECDSLCQQLKDQMSGEQAVEEIADDTKRDLAALLDRLRRHEHKESVMIGDAYYSDEGGRG
jgi:hypothetical protein